MNKTDYSPLSTDTTSSYVQGGEDKIPQKKARASRGFFSKIGLASPKTEKTANVVSSKTSTIPASRASSPPPVPTTHTSKKLGKENTLFGIISKFFKPKVSAKDIGPPPPGYIPEPPPRDDSSLPSKAAKEQTTKSGDVPSEPPPSYEEAVGSPPSYEEAVGVPSEPPPSYEEATGIPSEPPPTYAEAVAGRPLPKPHPSISERVSSLSDKNVIQNEKEIKKLGSELAFSELKAAGKPNNFNGLHKLQDQLINLSKDKLPAVQKELKLQQKVAIGLRQSSLASGIEGDTFESVLENLLAKHGVTPKDLEFETTQFGSKKIALLKMTHRLILYKQTASIDPTKVINPSMAKRMELTGYDVSTVKQIEKFIKHVALGKTTEKTLELNKETTFRVIHTDAGFLVEDKVAGMGGFKVVKFASDYFMNSSSQRSTLVTLELKTLPPPEEKDGPAKRPTSKAEPNAASETPVESGTTKIHEPDLGTTRINELDSSTTKINEADSGTTRINESDSSTTKIHETDSGTTKINESDSSTTKINEADSGTTKINAADLGTTRINEPDLATTKIADSGTPVANLKMFQFQSSQNDAEVLALLEKTPKKNLLLSQMKFLLGIKEKQDPLPKKEISELKEAIDKRQKEMKQVATYEEMQEGISAEQANKREYLHEIEVTERLQGKGVIRIHTVANLANGDRMMVQEAAGYMPKMIDGKHFMTKEGVHYETKDGVLHKSKDGKEYKVVNKIVDLEEMRELHKGGILTPEESRHMMDMVEEGTEAMVRMHEVGYINRDLKPANILMSPDGHGLLSDFGTAVLEDGDLLKHEFIGTVQFSAPETCRFGGSELWNNVTKKCDVWSFGMMIQDMLIPGQDVYSHPAVKEKQGMGLFTQLAMIHKKEEEYNKNYPEPADKMSFEHLIWSATRLNPDERPTMAECLQRYHDIKEHLYPSKSA